MKKINGFTLIEVLIVIAMVAILTAIAYPSYQANVTKSRRADAKAALTGFAQAMERYYTNNGTYQGAAENGDDTGSPTIFSQTSPLDGSDIYYNLEISSADASSYLLTADPDQTLQDGDGILTLASTGAKGWDSDDSGVVDSDEEFW